MLGHFDDTDARQQNNAHEHPPGEHTEDHSFGRRAAGGPRVGASPARAPRGTTAGGVPDGTPRGAHVEEPGLAWRPPSGRRSTANRTNEAMAFPRRHPWTLLQASPDVSHAAHRSPLNNIHTRGGGHLARALGVMGRSHPLDGLRSIPGVAVFLQSTRPIFIRARRCFGCLRGR